MLKEALPESEHATERDDTFFQISAEIWDSENVNLKW